MVDSLSVVPARSSLKMSWSTWKICKTVDHFSSRGKLQQKHNVLEKSWKMNFRKELDPWFGEWLTCIMLESSASVSKFIIGFGVDKSVSSQGCYSSYSNAFDPITWRSSKDDKLEMCVVKCKDFLQVCVKVNFHSSVPAACKKCKQWWPNAPTSCLTDPHVLLAMLIVMSCSIFPAVPSNQICGYKSKACSGHHERETWCAA